MFFAFGPEGVEVEEGFITFSSLPGGLLLEAGKLRGAFGKVNTMHTHALPWIDRPLVTRTLVGGSEGISDARLSVSKLVPNPALFLEATGEIFRGQSEVFAGSERSHVSYVGRLAGIGISPKGPTSTWAAPSRGGTPTRSRRPPAG